MVLLEERQALSHAHTPTLNPADLRRILGVGASADIPMAHRPGINVRLVNSLRQTRWNADGRNGMRGMESLIVCSTFAYFGAGLLGVLGIL